MTQQHRRDGYIPPKKPYSFEAMLDDILEFSTEMLVDEGRMSMWMPTANDEDVEIAIPSHPCLQLVSVCVQPFNKCKFPLPQPVQISYADHHLRVTETAHLPPHARRGSGQICSLDQANQGARQQCR